MTDEDHPGASTHEGHITSSGQRRRVLMYCGQFDEFTGGVWKLWHYYCHLRSSSHFDPVVYIPEPSRWDETNPWLRERERVVAQWAPDEADAIFIDGRRWDIMPPEFRDQSPVPIINLIQDFRHVNTSDPSYQYLRHKAIRICVSSQVADAIQKTGQVNGPVYVNPNAIDIECLPESQAWNQRAIDLLIVNTKRRHFGDRLTKALGIGRILIPSLRRLHIERLSHFVPRDQFLDKLGQTRVALLLPARKEGFYLPALEAMALGTLVLCPDAVGNRSFCHAGVNCLRPPYRVMSVLNAIRRAVGMDDQQRQRILEAASQTAADHSLERERKIFLELMDQIDQLWTGDVKSACNPE